jgi:NAD(P)H-hydrate repair Nnr-like enzyme with NAD(P)H-hydrate epimerase domain
MEMVLSRQEMQEMDRLTISEFGIPAETLMEVAGAKCAEIIRNVIPQIWITE